MSRADLQNIERVKVALARAGLTATGPPRAPTKWYETPFVGVKNAATEIKHNPTIRKVLDHVPYVGSTVKTVADKIGTGKPCPCGGRAKYQKGGWNEMPSCSCGTGKERKEYHTTYYYKDLDDLWRDMLLLRKYISGLRAGPDLKPVSYSDTQVYRILTDQREVPIEYHLRDGMAFQFQQMDDGRLRVYAYGAKKGRFPLWSHVKKKAKGK